MATFLKYLLRLLLFWLSFFLIFRIFESVAFFSLIDGEGGWRIIGVFYRGLPLDLSTIGYSLAVPILAGMLLITTKAAAVQRVMRFLMDGWSSLIIVVASLLCSAELATYLDWRGKVNGRLFFYLDHLGEGMRSATTKHLFLFFAPMLVLCLGGMIAYFRLVRLQPGQFGPTEWKEVPKRVGIGLMMSCLCMLAIRGNLSAIPINSSVAYYSSNTTLNDIATNPVWNFVASCRELFRAGQDNPYEEIPSAEVQSLVARMYHAPCEDYPLLLRNQQPDIVLIIQEGVSADMSGALGGQAGFSPVYDKLADEGVLFRKLYSAGWTSDVGHLSILSGFPALPQANPINRPEKYRKLPSVIKALKENGYRIGYHYGGDSNYGNIRGYLLDQGVDFVEDESQLDFPSSKGRLGYHDDAMYGLLTQKVQKAQGPTCHILFTLSTHTPYDIPGKVGLDYEGLQEDYARATYFSDSCLGVFVNSLKVSGKWDNTLLMMIADHSFNSVIERRALEHERYRIGWLMTGGALKQEYHGMRVDRLGSQLDFAATLLPQLGLNAEEFVWSKNLLLENGPEFASYVYPFGHGWMRPAGSYVFDYNQRVNHEEEFVSVSVRDSIVKEGKAFLQAAQQAYLDL